MAASRATIKQIVDILRDEVPGCQSHVALLVGRLYHEVEGNKSVRDTLRALWEYCGCPSGK